MAQTIENGKHADNLRSRAHWESLKLTSDDLIAALEAIAGMSVNEDTDHAQLSALCMAIASTALAKAKGEDL